MENYLKDEPVEEKLFYGQYGEASQIAFENDEEYKSLELELTEAFDKLDNFVKKKISKDDDKEFHNLIMGCQLSKDSHEQYANFCFYKLGLYDGIQLKKRFIDKG